MCFSGSKKLGRGAAVIWTRFNFDPERAPDGLSILTLKVFKFATQRGHARGQK